MKAKTIDARAFRAIEQKNHADGYKHGPHFYRETYEVGDFTCYIQGIVENKTDGPDADGILSVDATYTEMTVRLMPKHYYEGIELGISGMLTMAMPDRTIAYLIETQK